MKYCKSCGKSFLHKGKECRTCISRKRRVSMKRKAVDYLGGRCTKCGYNGHLAALEFHHLDGKDKDFAIGTAMNRKWESLEKEVDKCILLCSNCHRIEHSTY